MPTPIYVSPAEPTLVQLPASGTVVIAPLALAVDIGGYDWLDLELVVLSSSFTGGTGPGTTIGIATGMQIQTEDGWVNNKQSTNGNTNTAYDFQNGVTAVTLGTPNIQIRSFSGFLPTSTATLSTPLLRYIRWVVQFTGGPSAGSVNFYVRGMARQFAR